ncbi:GGDEF domain-containing protein [Vibrio sinaloensis]|nr:GGDEF domain-containing protein [Vibrio sinaloensis]
MHHIKPLISLWWTLTVFKPINDTYGHSAGDFLLKTIANRLAVHNEDGCKVYRLGGDEFVLILEEHYDRASVDELAHRLIARINTPIEYQGAALQVTASIGIAHKKNSRKQDIAAVIHDADLAMYEAKEKKMWNCFLSPTERRAKGRQAH